MPGILIVDDNSSIRLLLRSFVESKTKFAVCGEAGNGLQAIEKARQLQPDLVLLDLSMPVMNGADAAIALKRMIGDSDEGNRGSGLMVISVPGSL